MTNNSGVPSGAQMGLSFTYDSKGRRISKSVVASGVTNTLNFLYDGWNLLASLTNSTTLFEAFTWGLDLSGSVQGAGGVGGLLEVTYCGSATTNCFNAFDDNGNVSALVNAASGAVLAQYEYGPFGEVIRASGPMAKLNPFTFQTEFYDWETDKYYWKMRYYDASPSRWLSRDPAEEGGGDNLYCFVSNDPVNQTDELGLWATPVHHRLVEDWLDPSHNNNVDYHHYPWGCCIIDVIKAIQDGSDEVDGVGGVGNATHWCEAQSSGLSFQHAMRDGASGQTVAAAQALYTQFLNNNVSGAMKLADSARQSASCKGITSALVFLGKAYHSYSDSLSPAHAGFQPWWGPVDGPRLLGPINYYNFVETHESRETMAVYMRNSASAVNSVRGEFGGDLKSILAPPSK
jgi:RHS repeat-associated protein